MTDEVKDGQEAGLTPLKQQCPHCTKKLADANGAYMHVKAKHHGKRNPFAPKTVNRPQREEHQSMADLFIEGELNRAMGNPNPEWLEEMLP